MEFIIGLFIGIVLHIFYRKMCFCKHDWIFVERGEIRNRNGYKTGIYKTYECSKCKKFKDESS